MVLILTDQKITQRSVSLDYERRIKEKYTKRALCICANKTSTLLFLRIKILLFILRCRDLLILCNIIIPC